MAEWRQRFDGVVRSLMELSGERRGGPGGRIYGQTMSLRRRTIRFLASFGAAGGVVWLAAALLFPDGPCDGVLIATEFAGTGERFAERVAERFAADGGCGIDTMRSLLWRDLAFAAIYTTAFALLLTVWWNASWHTEPGYSRIPGVGLAGVAAATFVMEVAENGVTMLGLDPTTTDAGERSVSLRTAPLVSTLAWVKWALIGILLVAAGSMLLAWLIRSSSVLYRWLRSSDDALHTPAIARWRPPDEQPNLGICLSGGGIRSAGFSLGALSALEETRLGNPTPGRPPGLLGEADLLASVSGGGYAASCWRIAAGTAADPAVERPFIGNPNRHVGRTGTVPTSFSLFGDGAGAAGGPVADGADGAGGADGADGADGAGGDDGRTDLFAHVRELREYVKNGRGGMLFSAVVVVVQMAWHLLLTLALAGIVAWPIGRLIGSWVITSCVRRDDAGNCLETGIEYWRLARPIVGLLVVLAVVLVARSFTHRGTARNVANAASLSLLGLSGLLFVALIALPWLVTWVLPRLPGSTATNSTLVTALGGGVLASVLRVFRAPLKSRAPYLGGVLLVLGLLWFILIVASHAMTGDRLLSGNWRIWLLAVGAYVLALVTTNPDLWSLHWLYRRRLAQTFAIRWDAGAGAWRPMRTAEQPPLSAYDGAPGPKQVICAVAARGDVANTGIPVVSMTFEPDQVTLHCGPDPADPRATLSHAITTREYEQLFGGRLFAGRYRTVFSASALSAAAFAPSLGRHSLGTTNALIAALNMRLGAWMPNPMYRRGRRAGPNLFNMFKELTGRYDLDDPNLYVTDGGHWENLALVELVRRRTRHIISVDASGDKDHSFAALHEAMELAQLECGATIDFVDGDLALMRPGDRPKPAKNWCRAELCYADGSRGRLLYVKAQSSDQMPLDILRYAKEDPTFPNYSTADQLLTDAEFCHLAILGRESMIAALDDHHDWLFAAPPPPPGAAAAAAAAPVAADEPEVIATPSRRDPYQTQTGPM